MRGTIMSMTNAERQKRHREKQKAMNPKPKKPETKPLTEAERQRRHRGKLKAIKDAELAAELEEKRAEIIQYVETMPARDIQKLYDKTVEQQRFYDALNNIDWPAVIDDMTL